MASSRSAPSIVDECWATRMIFFISGFATSSWAPLVPYAKIRVWLIDGMLGLLLLCLGTGSIIAMPLSGFSRIASVFVSWRWGRLCLFAASCLFWRLSIRAFSSSLRFLLLALE